MMIKKMYLGDGCYAEFDGYQIVLTAENGISATDRIALEPEVYAQLRNFARSINFVYSRDYFDEEKKS